MQVGHAQQQQQQAGEQGYPPASQGLSINDVTNVNQLQALLSQARPGIAGWPEVQPCILAPICIAAHMHLSSVRKCAIYALPRRDSVSKTTF